DENAVLHERVRFARRTSARLSARLLRLAQFRRAFRQSFARRSEAGIECERLSESDYRAFLLVEEVEVTPGTNQHAGIDRRNLDVEHVIVFKLHRSISQSAGLQQRIGEVVRTLLARQLSNK